MRHEVTITFARPLIGVHEVDPEPPSPHLMPAEAPAPLAPPAPVGPSARELELEQLFQQERTAVQSTLDGVKAALRDLQAQQRHRLAEQERIAIELAVSIAARLIHDKIQADDYPVEELARNVVAQLEPREPVQLRLHPLDVALLERRLQGQPLFGDAAEVHVLADPSIGRGNCVAEAGPITVQSQLEKQLAEIREHLLRSLGNARTES